MPHRTHIAGRLLVVLGLFMIAVLSLAVVNASKPANAEPETPPGAEPVARRPGNPTGPTDPALPASVTAPNRALEPGSIAANYPPDPSVDTPWDGGYNGVADIAAAFNRARANENSMLGTFLKPLELPGQSTWNGMTEGDRALWLINAERVARGLAPLHGLETNVTQVAQAWAEWLLSHNQFSHEADGRTPWDRLNANPAIGTCHDFLGVAENLSWIGTTYTQGNPLPIEQAVYMWMYDDKASSWGHRHAILWQPYTENSGPGDREGFLGIGHARGGFTNPRDGRHFPFTETRDAIRRGTDNHRHLGQHRESAV
jgi:uncharacterized protein YkwD